jgi:isocitrate lyase
VSTQEHVDRLVAARLACDVLGTGTIIVARTDAEAATLLDSNMDGRDHPFILGVTVPGVGSLQDAIMASGGNNVDHVTQNWATRAKLLTFGEAVVAKIEGLRINSQDKRRMVSQWMAADPDTLSNAKARRVADSIFGQKDSVYFDWELCRVREGYYQIKPGIDYCIQRARAYAPHSDLIWMETGVPGIPDARKFAEGVKVSEILLNDCSISMLRVLSNLVFLHIVYVSSPDVGVQSQSKFQLGCIGYVRPRFGVIQRRSWAPWIHVAVYYVGRVPFEWSYCDRACQILW